MSSCCPRCHFRREEREIFPLLPPWIRAALAQEHTELERLDFPLERLQKHAATEMVFFAVYAPGMCHWVEEEHRLVDARLAAR